MTAYTAIADSEIDVDSPITESLMTRLRNNPIAITEGSAGAPLIQTAAYQPGSVDQAAIGASAVGQGELKSTTASGSAGGSANTQHSYSLTGGTYSFWTAGSNSGTNSTEYPSGFGNGDTGAGVIGVKIGTGAGSRYVYFDERYIQSSPPWDLGDGEIPLFVFAVLNSAGEIECVSVGEDPTWNNHGPTNLTATHKSRKNGKIVKYRQEMVLRENGLTMAQCRRQDAALFDEILRGKKRADLVPRLVELTPEYKNSDADLCPHPWHTNRPEFFAGRTVVMLDPFCKNVETLRAIFDGEGAGECRRIIEARFKFDNTEQKRKTPKGIKAHALKFH